MSQFVDFDIPEYSLSQNVTQIMSLSNICTCCLKENVPFIKFSTCKHTSFFEYFFKYKMEYSDLLICQQCHHLLKKFELFKHQVEESRVMLSTQTQNLKTHKTKFHTLQISKLEISSSINSQPIEVETINELDKPTNQEQGSTANILSVFPVNVDLENYDGIATEVKIENDSCSDLEIDMPLSQLRKEKKKRGKTKGKKEKVKRRPLNEKYDGKIRIVILSEEEMNEERKRDAQKEAYLNLPYKCESCITGFDHELTLKDHNDKRHTMKKGSYLCNICKSVLSTETSYKEHTKRHVRRYECEACGKRNHNVYSVVKHYNEQHGTISTQFTCDQCGFTTQSHRSYRYHLDKHKEKPQCSQCGNTFVNNTGLKIHMFTVHKQSSRVYSCATCNKVYNAKSGLIAHAASAHGAPARAGAAAAYCAPCRVHFRAAQNLRHHLRTHSRHINDRDKRFICDECGAKFLTKSSLQEHIDWVHLKNTKYECNKCSKVFKNNSSLKKHKNFVHEKKRPPRNKICDHCGRGFTTLSILRSHIRTHTGERPLRCTHCAAAFAHSAALYTHNKLLHGSAKN